MGALGLDRLEEFFWARHANPKSGWLRVPTGPLLVYAVYNRRWRLLLATLAWAGLNPFLFSSPRTDDVWMTRAVRAERWWIRERGQRTVGRSYPNVCNLWSAAAAVVALVAAWRRRPVLTVLSTVTSVAGKLWWLRAIVRRYEDREARR